MKKILVVSQNEETSYSCHFTRLTFNTLEEWERYYKDFLLAFPETKGKLNFKVYELQLTELKIDYNNE